MLIKLAALGALGYAGYRYFTAEQAKASRSATATSGDNLVAGGPLSSSATLQHSADAPSSVQERANL
jgi:uncharacterized membrane protein YebE (DUF533 family)